MKTTIVIPTYNRPGLALSLVGQIRKNDKKSEIIIVDQSAQEDDQKLIKKFNVKYLRDPQVNTAIAKNIGIEEAEGDVVIFFDDDVELTNQTIPSHLVEYEDKNVLAVAGRVINDGEEVPENTDVDTGKTNIFLTKFVGNFWGTRKQAVQFPYGCNMSFRKSILVDLKGFDKKITPPGFEEYDLGLRVTRLGKMIFAPDALVYHHRAKTGGNRLSKQDWFRKYYWNYGRMIKKHVPSPWFIYSLARLSIRILKEYPGALPSIFLGFFSK